MEQISHWLAHRPLGVLVIVGLIICPILSYFAFNPLRIESDVRRGFAQRNGRSTHELRSFSDFYNITYEGLDIWVILITPKRDGSEKYLKVNQTLLDEVERLDKFIQNFSIIEDKKVLSVADLEASRLNYLFDWFKYSYEWSTFLGDIDLSHPVGRSMGHEFFTGSHFFGTNRHTNESKPIESATYMTLWYISQAVTYEDKKRLEKLQMKLFDLSKADNFSSLISYQMYGDQVANAEMLRGTMFTVKLFIVGVVMMTVFMIYSFNHLEFKSQIIQTITAIASPTIATATCFGILGWTGTPFNSIMCITPFLVMGIGVDDAFLLLHCWRRNLHMENKQKRIQCVLLEIGPSMAITSVTNTLAFGIGMTSPTPQMSTFCLCTAIAVFLDLIFEFVIFVPIMILTYKEKDEKAISSSPSRFAFLSWTKYVNVLLSNAGRFIVTCLTIFLYISATYGVSNLIPSFDPSKTFPKDSELLVALQNFERIQLEYAPINFVSRQLPDLRNETQVESFFEMISRLENREFCYGSERTQLLLRDYINAINGTDLSYERVPKFLSDRQIADKKIMQYHIENNTVLIDGLNYIVICKGSLDWNERASRIERTRQIIDEYPQFNTTLFDYDSTIYDLIITVKYELIKAVLLTFVCMAVACGFMIPSFGAASIATLSMLSISYTLLGWLSIWGQDMDPVTMINVLMAIGFSVDFSAHVCYHYHIHRHQDIKMTAKERIESILKSVGRPMIEASFSTLLCMLPLFFVPVYIIESFARTVCLVASFGLFHGIVMIPVILSWLEPSKAPIDPNAREILLTSSA